MSSGSWARDPLSQMERILIGARRRFVFVRAEEIDWIQANGNYVRIHSRQVSYLHRQTVTGLERSLDPARFLRIHRSVIVNIDKIRELRPWPTGEYVVLMRSGKELTLSRSYRARLDLLAREPSPVDRANAGRMFSPIYDFSPRLGDAHDRTMSNRKTSNVELADRLS